MDKRTYLAIFDYDPSEEYKYGISFPDLPGCLSEGKNLQHGLEMAQEALALHLYGMEEDGDPIPAPSEIITQVEPNQMLVLITTEMDSFRAVMKNKTVKKTLTIPARLNRLAEQAGINFSQVLQNALQELLGKQ